MSDPVVSVDELTPSLWWELAALDEDPLEPSYWMRSLEVEIPGDDAGILLGVIVSDEGGPVVDVLTREHTIADLRALADVLPMLIARLSEVPVTRHP